MTTRQWTIDGTEGQPILGVAHVPPDEPRGVVIVAHGFKGYKDYGMFPRIATWVCGAGFIVHRLNFSHSGMTNDIARFERPDLFERDTWNKQVFDCRTVVEAVHRGDLPGGGLPQVLFGHSRGGATVLLTAGRFADVPAFPQPAGLVTAAAPSSTYNLSETQKETLRKGGFLDSPSSRTGQVLRIGPEWLREQERDPQSHDLLYLVSRIACPILVIHGALDPTVPVECAERIVGRASGRARTIIIDGGDHVFNTPNPFPEDGQPGRELRMLLDAVTGFASEVCAGAA